MDPKEWSKELSFVSLTDSDVGSQYYVVSVKWPMGLERRAVIQKSEVSGVARIDVVESEWMSGWAEVTPVPGEDALWAVRVDFQMIGGISGSFLEELKLRFQSVLASLVGAEDAL